MLRYSMRAFTRIFRSYGCEWRWKLSQLCLVRSIPWKAARIECHHLTFYISRIGGYSPCIQTLRFSSKSYSFRYNHSLHIQCYPPFVQYVWDPDRGKGTTSATEAPGPSEAQGDVVWAGEAQIQDNLSSWQGGNGISPSFSQNPKQVLVAPDSWCVRSKVFRHQRRLLYRRHGYVEAHQLPALDTFSSTVLASSWVPYTFFSTVQAPSWALLLYTILFLCLNKRWVYFFLNIFPFCNNYSVHGCATCVLS